MPLGAWVAQEDHKRVLRAMIRAGWPDRKPTWPALLEGGAVLRVRDAEANNWLLRDLRTALTHSCACGAGAAPDPHAARAAAIRSGSVLGSRAAGAGPCGAPSCGWGAGP